MFITNIHIYISMIFMWHIIWTYSLNDVTSASFLSDMVSADKKKFNNHVRKLNLLLHPHLAWKSRIDENANIICFTSWICILIKLLDTTCLLQGFSTFGAWRSLLIVKEIVNAEAMLMLPLCCSRRSALRVCTVCWKQQLQSLGRLSHCQHSAESLYMWVHPAAALFVPSSHLNVWLV